MSANQIIKGSAELVILQRDTHDISLRHSYTTANSLAQVNSFIYTLTTFPTLIHSAFEHMCSVALQGSVVIGVEYINVAVIFATVWCEVH